MIRRTGILVLFLIIATTSIAQQAVKLKNDADSLKSIHRYDQAIDLYYQAKTISEKEENDSLTGVIAYKMGYVYSKMEQHEAALTHYKSGIKLHEQGQFEKSLAAGYTMLGRAYRKLGTTMYHSTTNFPIVPVSLESCFALFSGDLVVRPIFSSPSCSGLLKM